MTRKALEYLEEAETVILSHMRAVADSLNDEDSKNFPDVNPVFMAVQRLISRAAGAIEEALSDRDGDGWKELRRPQHDP